jgi:hypothetical protein
MDITLSRYLDDYELGEAERYREIVLECLEHCGYDLLTAGDSERLEELLDALAKLVEWKLQAVDLDPEPLYETLRGVPLHDDLGYPSNSTPDKVRERETYEAWRRRVKRYEARYGRSYKVSSFHPVGVQLRTIPDIL